MSRQLVSHDDITVNDYNNDVDNVTNRIASSINREGTQVPNLGTMLGKRICTNLERNMGKTLCGLNQSSDLNIVITVFVSWMVCKLRTQINLLKF